MKNAVEELGIVSLTCVTGNPSEACSKFTAGTAAFLPIPVFPLGWELFSISITVEFNSFTTKWYDNNTIFFYPEFHPFMMPNTTVAEEDHRYLLCRKLKGFCVKSKTMWSSEKYCSGWDRRQGSCPARGVNGMLVHQVFPWMLMCKCINK